MNVRISFKIPISARIPTGPNLWVTLLFAGRMVNNCAFIYPEFMIETSDSIVALYLKLHTEIDSLFL